MRKQRKVIVTCAVTGAIHTPTLSAYLPYRPEDIAEQAIAAAQAGASILHLHARNPETGAPTGSPEIFAKFLPVIKERTNAVINLTTGGSPEMTVEDRLAAALKFRPEMCSLNMGSINFSMHPLVEKVSEWKFPWEREYLLNSEAFIFRNTFRDISRIYQLMTQYGTRFEHECYDIGHLYNLAYFLDKGLVKPPLFIQSVFGILGGIGPESDNVVFMRRTADRLFGDDYVWSVLAAGRHQMPVATQSALMGGNVRVGLEDSLYIGRGQLAKSNAEQVRKIKGMLSELSLDIATPDEARAMLQLKGADNVSF
ncbi:3-keto-5-aminohexanoate cleavage protein [Caballeronia sp. INSB1]|uniref:3-keto-5-aminohexanoate cleavage protein n=1 Tax=Caballeronia sp. INSB1 TaxID=2921751 RepID=UPI0020325529|nr:3-keto-5-aminohexanoate cleavage protein [Caballeronia sp. INSB1]